MPEGLLAQWQRGIALRGIAGAALLMIPVLVAATIGFGGIGGGLTSLAAGPSASAVDTSAGPQDRSARSLDTLSAAIPTAAPSSQPSSRNKSTNGSTPKPDGAAAPTPSGGAASPSDSSGGEGNAAGATGGGVSGAEAPPASSPIVVVPQSQPDVLGDLLQGLLNGGQGSATP